MVRRGNGGLSSTSRFPLLEHPDEAHWDELFAAATATYPFGPGDGCHAVAALGGHGAPGSGCTSGIGFLDSLAGAAKVLEALRRELTSDDSFRFR